MHETPGSPETVDCGNKTEEELPTQMLETWPVMPADRKKFELSE
jgi:hypothetical protein